MGQPYEDGFVERITRLTSRLLTLLECNCNLAIVMNSLPKRVYLLTRRQRGSLYGGGLRSRRNHFFEERIIEGRGVDGPFGRLPSDVR